MGDVVTLKHSCNREVKVVASHSGCGGWLIMDMEEEEEITSFQPHQAD